MTIDSNIGRNIGPAGRAPLQSLARNVQNIRRPVELRHAETVAGAASGNPKSPLSSPDSSFAGILTRLSQGLGNNLPNGLSFTRMPAQRSSLLSARLATSLSPAQTALLNTDSTNVADLPYADLLLPAARKHGVSAELAAAVIKAESGFNPQAQSGAGAKGLMQLMDGTARSLGISDSFDPAQNIEGGIKFLSSLLKKYNGNTALALAAYNAGPGAVDKYGGIPPYKETRDYVARVVNFWKGFGGNPLASTSL